MTHGLGPRWPAYLELAAAGDLDHLWAREGLMAPPRARLGRFLYLEEPPAECYVERLEELVRGE